MYGEGDGMAAEITEDRVIEVAEVVPGRRSRSDRQVTDDLVIDLRPDVEETPDAPASTPGAEEPSADAAALAPGPLHGRVAVVTGGAAGVGREIALGLARSGARVCVLGRELAQLRETVDLAGPGAAILYLQCDVGSVSEIDGVVDFIARFDRPVDLLVHAEGVQVRGGVEHGSINDLDEQYLVNVRGPYLMSQKLAAQLRSGGGHVVFVNPSPSGEHREAGQFAITAEAVQTLAATLRAEVGADGIRVTTVRPELPATSDLGDVVALAPGDVAASVLHAVQTPRQVEVTELVLRPRSA